METNRLGRIAAGVFGLIALVAGLVVLAALASAALCLLSPAGGCVPVAVDAASVRPALCRPTGWVDRIEGGIAVVEPDNGVEEEVYPAACFPEPVRAGTRVVEGRIDLQETDRVRREMDAILARLLGEGNGKTPE